MRDDEYVYLDWAATSPLRPEAACAMQLYLVPGTSGAYLWANPNSLHAPGRRAFAHMEEMRRVVARCIGAGRPSEVIFTSGATEANNAALFGIARAVAAERRQQGKDQQLTVITSAIEHESVARPAEQLKREGFEVVLLNPTRAGFIEPAALERALTEQAPGQVALVSIQAANGEIGCIQPVRALAEVAHAYGALFHTDATQALGKVAFSCADLGVDAASFSAHKIGGPKGVGALYVRMRTPFQPLLLGGGQEGGQRSTTQNVCGISGFAAACEAACATNEAACATNEAACATHEAACATHEEEIARERRLRDWLYGELCAHPGVQAAVEVPRGSTEHLPHIVTVLVQGWESETLVLRLDARGFGVSGGSACSSHSLEPSHVLRALGVASDLAQGELRISFGNLTTECDLQKFVQAFTDCIV